MALQSACLHRPDVLIFEIKLPDMDGFKVLQQLRQEGVTTPAIAYTAEPVDENHIIALWQLNVRGVVLKSMAPDFLVKSVQVVHEGGEWLEQGLLSRAFKKLLSEPPPPSLLTKRELQLTRLIAQDLSNAAIANALNITEGTVKVHLHRIFTKLGVTSRLGLAIQAMEKQWL